MEHYVFSCGKCGKSYSYVGYKTGIGKSEAQLKQMEDEAHVCRECGYDDRTGEEKNEQKLDYGDNASSVAVKVVSDIFSEALKGTVSDDCSICSNKDFDYNMWELEQVEKYGWFTHFVNNDPNYPLNHNIHTHGILEAHNHMDFQVVIPMSMRTVQGIFFGLVDQIKEGREFKVGENYSQVIRNFDVTFFKTVECDREVLRLILPDEEGHLIHGSFTDDMFALQYS